MPRVENAAGPRSRPSSKRKTATSSGLAGGLQNDRAQLAERTDQFRSKRADGFDALHLRMKRGGGFKLEVRGGLVALRLENHEAALAAGGQKAFDGGGFFGIALVGAALVAGREAHLHLGIDAAGMAGIGIEIVGAAAQQKKLESLVGIALGGGARRERAVRPVGFALAGAVGDGDARIGIAAEKADEGGARRCMRSSALVP